VLRRLLVLLIALLAVIGTCVIPVFSAAANAATGQPTAKQYYLALGDSLAAGDQPNGVATQGYANQLDTELRSHGNILSLVDLGCAGETTWTFIHGGACWYSGEPGMDDQLRIALDFLQAHPGHVPLITIDIGGNDLNACDGLSSVSAADACGQSLIPGMSRNLTAILKALRAADPSAVITGLNYYVPQVFYWIDGAAGRSYATAQLSVTKSMNAALAADYKATPARNADVFSKFKSDDLTDKTNLPGHGSVPVAVALVCQWTWMCASGDDHANKAGYGAIAAAIYAILPASIAKPAGKARSLKPAGLSPAERGRHVGEDAVDDVGVVVDAELVGHGEQQRVGGCDRLVLFKLLDQHIRLGRVRAAEDRLGLRVDEPDLVGVLIPLAEVRPVPVVDQGEDAPAYRHTRLPLVASLPPGVTEGLDLLSLLQVKGFVRLVSDQRGTLQVQAQLGRPGGGLL
jgi:lysophospholipase L1-like esterase